MIDVTVLQCFAHDLPEDERDPHQVVITVDGVRFWMQMPAKNKDEAQLIAEKVKSAISTQVARLKVSDE